MPPFDHFGILAPVYEHFIRPRMPDGLLELADLPPGGVVLDATGGTGRVAQFLSARAAQVVVSDESAAMLREAKKKGRLQAVCAHTELMPFPGEYFDRIIMVDPFHHVADQQRTARELWRVLKVGGRIVIEEPDIRSLAAKMIALGEKLAFMRSHFLGPRQISTLFASQGAYSRIATDNSTAWIIVEKRVQTSATLHA